MARPLRIEFPGALYHVTSRGDGREAIYLSDNDRLLWLDLLGEVCRRFNWQCHAYCLMDNHYHLLIETPEANLSLGMRHLNGVYTQRFNRQHQRVGHVFQGRFKGILVDKESYLVELARYIVLNPVRARMVRSARECKWSSYRATAGFEPSYPWLNADWLLSSFSSNRGHACKKYRQFVSEGKGQPSPWESLKNQMYFGSDQFVEKMQALIDPEKNLDEVPTFEKRALAKPISYYEKQANSRNAAICDAYRSGAFSMKALADYYGLHYSSISKIIKNDDDSRIKT